MVRGTFANIRIRNQLAPGTEGGVTRHLPDGEVMSIYDASMKYQKEGVPLVVLAGAEYGTGSSRDWAAKGTMLLGAKAVIAASYERIHRSNLVGMGVLPLEFAEGATWQSLGLTGEETIDIPDLSNDLQPRSTITVHATDTRRKQEEFSLRRSNRHTSRDAVLPQRRHLADCAEKPFQVTNLSPFQSPAFQSARTEHGQSNRPTHLGFDRRRMPRLEEENRSR